MQLQALTTSEVFNIQMSIARQEPGHWVDESEDAYPTRENFYPFQFVSQFSTEAISQIEYHDGPPPSVFRTDRIRCSLCSTTFPNYNIEFYRHSREKHVQHPDFFEAVKAHWNKWKQAKGRTPPYNPLERLLMDQLTLEEALLAIDEAAPNCALCPANQVRPYHWSTWLHLNTHFADPRYLEVVISKGQSWDQDMQVRSDANIEFLDSLLADGATKEEVRDLIDRFAGKNRGNRKEKGEPLSPVTPGSRKRKSAHLDVDVGDDDEEDNDEGNEDFGGSRN
jgi:hypothetical protein